MIILSHRGYWLSAHEKNCQVAFERSFSLGFGIETDVRDFNGQLVISHDTAKSNAMPLEAFFALYLKYRDRPKLALNIKADGLQDELHRQIAAFGIDNYFLFDMAVPDGLGYLRRGMTVYTRHSEYEPIPPYYKLASGVWLDEFDGHWLSDEVIKDHIEAGKNVCIVSPELHNRSHKMEWAQYKELEQRLGKDRLMLCTDLPEQAKGFFND
jgi:glycerophosphoryl diester phosphodiesterase